ncbi:MAG: J domain-containing protein [Pirellulaceae bacterium]
MSHTSEFVDYYELLEVSPKASIETIEKMFRFQAQKYHPDAGPTADVQKFKLLVDACHALMNPEVRTNYDLDYQKHKDELTKLVKESSEIGNDTADRRRLLSLFYTQRRRDRKTPGIGGATLEHLTQLPPDILEFHLWYFRDKGWIMREESGLLSITALGVDRIETMLEQAESQSHKRIEKTQFVLPGPAHSMPPAHEPAMATT